MTQWTKDKEKRILYKYRFTLTIKILRVLAAILLVWAVYKIGISIAFDKSNAGKKHSYYSNVALEWTNPNLSGGVFPNDQSEITSFLTQKINYPVYRKVGKEEQYVGEIKINKSLFSPFSTMELETTQPEERYWYDFYLPFDKVANAQLPAPDDVDVWRTLEKIHEGTVADLAFSTASFLTPEELLEKLSDVYVDILWMPLDTGEFTSFKPNGVWGGGGITSVAPFGLTGGSEVEDDYRSGWGSTSLNKDSIEQSKETMLKTMEHFLQNESKGYYEDLLRLDYLEERYNYLKENGFEVYGAVVTGPVTELLKLKDVEGVRGVQLGKFEHWNWYK